MAVTYRGLYLVGNKRAQRIRAVQIVGSAGKPTTVRLAEYILRRIEPEYKTLPSQEDVVKPANPKS
jgi:UDP-N-acetylmuramyl pentapeptide synthase